MDIFCHFACSLLALAPYTLHRIIGARFSASDIQTLDPVVTNRGKGVTQACLYTNYKKTCLLKVKAFSY